MVRSSYKNRKKNRKQSFKRRITGGNREVNFIDDKMVGGNPETITRFINKYTEHPIYGVLLAIYSNQKCAVENDDGTCKVDNTAQLKAAYKKSIEIMGKLPDVPDKPTSLTVEQEKESDSNKGTEKVHKVNYVGEVIDYLAQNVFIPKTIIHKVHVQNDSDDGWTTLTNTKFVEVKSDVTKGKTRVEMKEDATAKTAAQLAGEKGTEPSPEVKQAMTEMTNIAEGQDAAGGGGGKLERMKSKAAELLTLLESDTTDDTDKEHMKTVLSNIIESKSSEDAVVIWIPRPDRRPLGQNTETVHHPETAAGAGQQETPTVVAGDQ